MENTALILIAVALILLVLVIGLLAVLIFKIVKNQPPPPPNNNSSDQQTPHPDISKSEFHPEILERMKDMQKVKPKRADLFCPHHTDEPGETVCAICDKMYCKACIKPFKAMHFCKEHLPLIMKYDWEEVLTLKTSTQDPERGVKLYEIKKEIFEKDDLPTYIETHYKINVDQDYIETYLVVYAQKENKEKLKEKIELELQKA